MSHGADNSQFVRKSLLRWTGTTDTVPEVLECFEETRDPSPSLEVIVPMLYLEKIEMISPLSSLLVASMGAFCWTLHCAANYVD